MNIPQIPNASALPSYSAAKQAPSASPFFGGGNIRFGNADGDQFTVIRTSSVRPDALADSETDAPKNQQQNQKQDRKVKGNPFTKLALRLGIATVVGAALSPILPVAVVAAGGIALWGVWNLVKDLNVSK